MRLLSRSAVRECANSLDHLEPCSGRRTGLRAIGRGFRGDNMRAGISRGRASSVLSMLGRLRSFRIGALLVFVGIATLILSTPPAQAYWTTVSYVGCNTSTDCPTVEVACQKWLAYWQGFPGTAHWDAVVPDPNIANARQYCVINGVNLPNWQPNWPTVSQCPSGYYRNPSTITGCSDYPPEQCKNCGPN